VIAYISTLSKNIKIQGRFVELDLTLTGGRTPNAYLVNLKKQNKVILTKISCNYLEPSTIYLTPFIFRDVTAKLLCYGIYKRC
jgi:hypothetical protein